MSLHAWVVRSLLAALLLFGSEILFWNTPAVRSLPEWGALALGYVVVASILLDLMVRYRVRDLWGVMIVLGIYGMLNALLLNPATILDNVPNAIFSRGLGGHWFIGMEMMGVFLALTYANGQAKRLLLIGAFVVGFNWAVWVYWFPAFVPGAYMPVLVWEIGVYAGIAILPALLLWGILRYRLPDVPAEALRFGEREWAVLALVVALIFFGRVVQGQIDGLGLLICLITLVILWTVLWFRGDSQKPTGLTQHLPVQRPMGWFWLILAMILLGGGAALAYTLPLVTFFGLNQFTLLQLVFSGVGVGWIPLMAAVLGVKTFTRQMQTAGY